MSPVHSTACIPRKMAPPRIVRPRNIFVLPLSPFFIADSAFTIVTLLQMRMKVMNAVVWIPRTFLGSGQFALEYLSAPYPASSPPKLIASAARKIHIPSFPQLSGVSGDSTGSTACSIVAAWLNSDSSRRLWVVGRCLRFVRGRGGEARRVPRFPAREHEPPRGREEDREGHGDHEHDAVAETSR